MNNSNADLNTSFASTVASNEKARLAGQVNSFKRNSQSSRNSSFGNSLGKTNRINPYYNNYNSPSESGEPDDPEVLKNMENPEVEEVLENVGDDNRAQNSDAMTAAAAIGLESIGIPKGLAEKIAKSKAGQKAISKAKKKNPLLKRADKLLGVESEENEKEEDRYSFDAMIQKAKPILFIMIPAFSILIFCCLFVTAANTYLNVVTLGHADDLAGEDASEKLDKLYEDNGDEIDKVASDDDLEAALYVRDGDLILYETPSSESNLFLATKLSKSFKRERKEYDLMDLYDFYPGIVTEADGLDKKVVWDFYYKLYTLYNTYAQEYNVYLDIPLLVSTLKVQSNDMYDIFVSNLSIYDRASTKRSENMDEFKYDYDWSGYKLTRNLSTHDMEILAQNMVSKNGDTYTLDEEKYNEFLREYIEKKYYLPNGGTINDAPEKDWNDATTTGSTSGGTSAPHSIGNENWRKFRQCDPAWGGVALGNTNICSVGCLVTSITIQIVRSGTATVVENVNPGVAARYFTFSSGGGLTSYASVQNLAPYFKFTTQVSTVGMSKQQLASRLSSLAPNEYAILWVGESKAHHYVAVDYVDTATGDIYMIDPGSEKSPKVYDSYRVYQYQIWTKGD